jgi:hypothetical protein
VLPVLFATYPPLPSLSPRLRGERGFVLRLHSLLHLLLLQLVLVLVLVLLPLYFFYIFLCIFSGMRSDRAAGCFPAGVAAFHVLGVKACLAQRDRGLAADMEAVGAEHHDRLVLRQVADPLL